MIIFILVAIGVFLWLKEKRLQYESHAVKEEERHNIVRPLSNSEIENQYFNMKTDIYLKKKYPTMISWEWSKGAMSALHYARPSNGINVLHRDGSTEHVLVKTKEIWTGYQTSVPNGENDVKPTESLQKDSVTPTAADDTSVTNYLVEQAAKIEETVKAAMEKGCGFFTKFEVDKTLATEEFMKNLAQEIEKNTEYEVSFKDNVLEINFQNAVM